MALRMTKEEAQKIAKEIKELSIKHGFPKKIKRSK